MLVICRSSAYGDFLKHSNEHLHEDPKAALVKIVHRRLANDSTYWVSSGVSCAGRKTLGPSTTPIRQHPLLRSSVVVHLLYILLTVPSHSHRSLPLFRPLQTLLTITVPSNFPWKYRVLRCAIAILHFFTWDACVRYSSSIFDLVFDFISTTKHRISLNTHATQHKRLHRESKNLNATS